MLGHIVQRLLGDAHDGQRGVGRQLREPHVGGAHEARRESRAFGERASPLRQRGNDAPFDVRLMKLLDEAPSGFACCVERLLCEGERSGGGLHVGVSGQRMLDVG